MIISLDLSLFLFKTIRMNSCGGIYETYIVIVRAGSPLLSLHAGCYGSVGFIRNEKVHVDAMKTNIMGLFL